MSLLGRIAVLREQHGGISINKLEKEAGINRGSIAKWDDHAPSYDKVKKSQTISVLQSNTYCTAMTMYTSLPKQRPDRMNLQPFRRRIKYRPSII